MLISRWNIEEHRRKLFPNITDSEWNDWHWHLKQAPMSLEHVMAHSVHSESERNSLTQVLKKYPVMIVPYYLCLIDFSDPIDPILIQSFPMHEEVDFSKVGHPDPLEEEADMTVPGLVHRYPDRVLMQVTNLCPMNCRYCTRKREWEEGLWSRDDREIDRMVDYLRKTPQVRDVLISGGDPLVLGTVKLERILAQIRAIEHIEIIRIGTRFPVVLPQRINREYRPLWVNTHFNHPREITEEAARACDLLQRAGIPMNNQSVLLRGVNDNLPTMRSLCHELLKIGVRPYYLYQCDPVKGTEHLRTSVWKGIEIIEGLRGHTTGFAVPQFVVDAPGGGGKIPVGPNYFLEETQDSLILRNYEGLVFEYPNPHRNGEVDNERIRKNSFFKSERLNRRKKSKDRYEQAKDGKHYHGQRDWVPSEKSTHGHNGFKKTA
jgi:lysine 2,3-aminomutase